jgi:hypothetical protein
MTYEEKPAFSVRGVDGRDYPADLRTLREWLAAGRVSGTDQVYWHDAEQWLPVNRVPMLRDVFTPPRKTSNVPFMLAGCAGFGCLTFIGLVVLGLALDKWVPTPKIAENPAVASRGSHTSPPEPSRPAATPAQRRVAVAAELQRIFDSSDLKGWEMTFRGARCDVLHVQGDVNLHPEMMEALGYGTVEYGRVLPGGVNRYAFDAGFRDVIYTNPTNPKYKSFGSSKLTAQLARAARRCTDEIAAAVPASEEVPIVRSEEPKFEAISWENAKVGEKLYDGSYRHDVTIVALDPANDVMEVRYVKTGRVEPKRLSAVAQYWYVKE